MLDKHKHHKKACTERPLLELHTNHQINNYTYLNRHSDGVFIQVIFAKGGSRNMHWGRRDGVWEGGLCPCHWGLAQEFFKNECGCDEILAYFYAIVTYSV